MNFGFYGKTQWEESNGKRLQDFKWESKKHVQKDHLGTLRDPDWRSVEISMETWLVVLVKNDFFFLHNSLA